ncbi:hypothetical protein ACJMQP_03995 [Rhodopseudomonas palustris]
MTTLTIELKLADEDLKAISANVAKQIEAAKAKTNAKGATAGKGGKGGKGAKTPPAEDDFDADGDGDGEGEGEGDDGDGDGDDDFEGGAGEPEHTRDDVQAALREYAAVTCKADAMKLLSKYGESNALSTLDEDKFGAVIKAAKAATAKAKKAK